MKKNISKTLWGGVFRFLGSSKQEGKSDIPEGGKPMKYKIQGCVELVDTVRVGPMLGGKSPYYGYLGFALHQRNHKNRMHPCRVRKGMLLTRQEISYESYLTSMHCSDRSGLRFPSFQ